MLEIEDLSIIWPDEIPESMREARAIKEYYKTRWSLSFQINDIRCSKHVKCTRLNNHLGPCMKFVPIMTPVPNNKDLFRLKFRIDAKRVPLEESPCQSTE